MKTKTIAILPLECLIPLFIENPMQCILITNASDTLLKVRGVIEKTENYNNACKYNNFICKLFSQQFLE